MTNAFTFNPLSGKITDGITICDRKPKDNFGNLHPPHIAVGSRFLMVDRIHHPHTVDQKVMDMSIAEKQAKSGKSFLIATRRFEGETSVFLLFDGATVPRGFKRHVNGNAVGAWCGFAYGDIHPLRYDTNAECFLLAFGKNAEVYICTKDGAVYRFRRDGNIIAQIALTPAEMAEVRVAKAREQVERFADEPKRVHGILWGIIRLLQNSRKYPSAMNVFVDFLTEFNDGTMYGKMLDDIRAFLHAMDHDKASWFYDTTDVVPITTAKSRKIAVGGDGKTRSLARKCKRSDADKQLRLRMRGGQGKKSDK